MSLVKYTFGGVFVTSGLPVSGSRSALAVLPAQLANRVSKIDIDAVNTNRFCA
jgi:hypothetical protein